MAESDKHVDPGFNAFEPKGFRMDVEFFDDGDEPILEAEGGLLFEYTEEELQALGEGDSLRGVERIWEAIQGSGKTMNELAVDPRRPLQDELDLRMPPTAKPN